MNQILYTGGKKEKKRSGPADIKSIIKFFCITTIVFSVAITGQASYGLYKEITNNKSQGQNKEQKPEILLETIGADKIKLTVTHNKNIDTISYNWNGEEDIIINNINSTSTTKEISMPGRSATLNIKITDENGQEQTYSKEYKIGESPEITLTVKENSNKIKIIVNDDTQINKITYKWDQEEETTINIDEANKTQVEQEIEIPKGDHTLVVTAEDSDKNIQTKTQAVKGVVKPDVVVTLEGNCLVIKATDETALDRIDFIFNGNKYRVQANEGQTELIYKQEMVEGENKIEVTAYNKDGVTAEFKAKCNYTP